MSHPPRLVRTFTVCNEKGLHSRPSAAFARLAARFPNTTITVSKEGETVSATSILGLMMLGAAPGTELEIATEGAEAETAMEEVGKFITDRFGEGETPSGAH